MKCKYTFKIEGEIKPTRDFLIPLGGYLYDFVTQNGLITHISVTVPNFNELYLPSITSHPEGRIKASINIPQDPIFPKIQQELRTFQGLLALFGLESIEIDNPKIEWIPETAEEKKKIQLINTGPITYSKNKLPARPLEHDILVRSLIAAKQSDEAKSLEIPLNFYRKGSHDIFERRYIESIYDFYFVIESIYGNGKFKKREIVSNLTQSAELRNSIKKALESPDNEITRDNALRKIYEQNIASKSIEEIIEYIVDLRGFLHHHTIKNKKIWHPDKHNDYKVEALFLFQVCFNIALELFSSVAINEETKNIYQKIKFVMKNKN